MTLPIWRDKLAAEVAQAKANELAAKSKLKAGQIDLAVNFAEKSFTYREISRNLALIENESFRRRGYRLKLSAPVTARAIWISRLPGGTDVVGSAI